MGNGVLPPCKQGQGCWELANSGGEETRDGGKKESGGCRGCSGDGGGGGGVYGAGTIMECRGVLMVVFRKQVGSYRTDRQGHSRLVGEGGRRADEKEQDESSKEKKKARWAAKGRERAVVCV